MPAGASAKEYPVLLQFTTLQAPGSLHLGYDLEYDIVSFSGNSILTVTVPREQMSF